MRFGPYQVDLSHQTKVFFPETGITKGDLVEYYRKIAPAMLPYMKDRPLTLHRFPDGINGKDFYQKETPEYFPDWIDRVEIQRKKGGVETQVVCNNTATLVYIANQGCIVPHIWLSRVGRLDFPDKLIFDLDPPGNDFELVRKASFMIRDILEGIGLAAFVMTTGSRGLHVVVPLDRSTHFDTALSFAQDVAAVLSDRHPDQLTVEQRKDRRKGRLFLDVFRNAYAQTSVAPYAIRAKEGAPVATPLDWYELTGKDLNATSYTMDNIFDRLGDRLDPWKGIMRKARSLQGARNRLDSMMQE